MGQYGVFLFIILFNEWKFYSCSLLLIDDFFFRVVYDLGDRDSPDLDITSLRWNEDYLVLLAVRIKAMDQPILNFNHGHAV